MDVVRGKSRPPLSPLFEVVFFLARKIDARMSVLTGRVAALVIRGNGKGEKG